MILIDKHIKERRREREESTDSILNMKLWKFWIYHQFMMCILNATILKAI